jgi:hypothetical protein
LPVSTQPVKTVRHVPDESRSTAMQRAL